jgi:hypothetical protein
VGRHGLYSRHYSGVFFNPKNAQKAETKRQSGAVPILLLALLALMTSAYSSLGVLQGLNPQCQLLKASVYHLATSAREIVAISGCNNDCLKVCIIALLVSSWGVLDMFPSQLNVVFCLLHSMHLNHLMVIQQTGTGKAHILWMLGVIECGIVLIFIPPLTLSASVMSKFTYTNQRFGAVIIQRLNELYNANNVPTKIYWSNAGVFFDLT